MNINYVVGKAGNSLASYRYRCAIPGSVLEKRGHGVMLGNHHEYADVHFYLKHFYPGALAKATVDKEKGSKVVFDISDNHFHNEHREFYVSMCGMADIVTCPNWETAGLILNEAGKKKVNVKVVSDPYEFPEAKPKFEGTQDLLWYGHPTNIMGLFCELPKLSGHNLRIISRLVHASRETLSMQVPDDTISNIKAILDSIVPWSLDNMLKGFHECDMVIIPVEDKPDKALKSPNRMVEALRQGRFVVANPIPAYHEFEDYVYLGDIAEGIQWARDNKESIPERIRAAQEYIRDNYSPGNIADHWEAVFNE